MSPQQSSADDIRGLHPTLDAVISKQLYLLDMLDRLCNGEKIKEEERKNMLETVAYSLLGQGIIIPLDTPFSIKSDSMTGRVHIQNVEDLIRFLLYYRGDTIAIQRKEISVKELWKLAREMVLRTIPYAIRQAVIMSPEKPRREPYFAGIRPRPGAQI